MDDEVAMLLYQVCNFVLKAVSRSIVEHHNQIQRAGLIQ